MLAPDRNVQRNLAVVERLLGVVCDADAQPWFVSDEATVFDVSLETESEIKARICVALGQAEINVDLTRPLWELATMLYPSPD